MKTEKDPQLVAAELEDAEIQELEREIEFHDHQYFVLSAPVISDEEYDLLRRKLSALKPDSPVLARVGARAGLESFRDKVEHASSMLSLGKCYSDEEFFFWTNNTVAQAIHSFVTTSGGKAGDGLVVARHDAEAELAARYARFSDRSNLSQAVRSLKVAVSPKIDGVAASLRYDENGDLMLAATRGDGRVGEDFTINARLVREIPWKVGLANVEVRGEVHMRRSVFQKYYAANFPNSRNLTAGSLKQKQSGRKQLLDLSFFAYDLMVAGPESEEEKFRILSKLGFRTVPVRFVTVGEVPQIYEEWIHQRNEWDFDADGIVIRLDDTGLHAMLGATAHHPRYAMAYKFQGDTAWTTLRDLDWNVSRTGSINPVGLLEPTFLSGARVSRSSLHNVHFIKGIGKGNEKSIYATEALRQARENGEGGFYLGDKVRVTRRGGVIPKIEETLGGGSRPLPLPLKCPSCGADTIYAAPVAFAAGARIDISTDDVEMDDILAIQASIAESMLEKAGSPRPSILDITNAVARYQPSRTLKRPKYGRHALNIDDGYSRTLSWKIGRSTKENTARRERIKEILNQATSIRAKDPLFVVVFFMDPDLQATRDLFKRLMERIEHARLDLRLLLTTRSRFEPRLGPAGQSLVEAGRRGAFFQELWDWEARMDQENSPEQSPQARTSGRLECHASRDFSEEALVRTMELAWQTTDTLTCSRPDTCRDTTLGRLEHFIQTIGVDGFGRKWIEKLYDRGLLKCRADFFQLEKSKLLSLDRMGETLASKLLSNVERAAVMPLSTFLVSLGVEQLGPKVAEILVKEYHSLDNILLKLSTKDPSALPDTIGSGIARQVYHGLRKLEPEIHLLLGLDGGKRQPLIKLESTAPTTEPESLPLEGRSFVFTGKLNLMDRKTARARVEALGGKTPSQPTKNLDYLVVGDDGPAKATARGRKSSKLLKAQKMMEQGAAIQIISEEQFTKMLEQIHGGTS